MQRTRPRLSELPGFVSCPDPDVPLTPEQFKVAFAGNQQIFANHLRDLTLRALSHPTTSSDAETHAAKTG
jgi:hypothetical protein